MTYRSRIAGLGPRSKGLTGKPPCNAPGVFAQIASVGYDASTRVLEVQFRSGSVYQYSDVPASVHRALMMASSHGSYLNRYVKGRFRYRQVS
jgi:KTSC domain-containing protein